MAIILSKSGSGTQAKSSSEFRGVMPTTPNGVYYLSDKTREGVFILDPTDTTSEDNDGTTFVSSNNLRFKRVYVGAVLATWFRIIPNDRSKMASNSAILYKLTNNSGSHIIMNGPGNSYYIGRCPVQRAFPDTPYCIGLIDFVGTFECERAVTLVTQQEHVGLHVMRTGYNSDAYLKNISLAYDGGRGASPDHGCIGYKKLSDGTIETQKPADLTGYRRVYTQNWGDYKWNGLNMWGAGGGENIRISGYPGVGLCVFGATTIKFNGPRNPIHGSYVNFGDSLSISIDNMTPGLLGAQSTVGIDGVEYAVGGIANGNIAALNGPKDPSKIGQPYTGYTYKPGSTLFADSMSFTGKNEITINGACGIFTTGDEANQSNFDNFRIADNGAWAVCDSSLLKNMFDNLHSTANGQYFNDFSVQPAYTPIGGVTNRGDSNSGSTLSGKQYREGGNEGLDSTSGDTVYPSSGVFGGGDPDPNGSFSGLIGTVLRGIRGVKMISLGGAHYTLVVDNNGVLKTIQEQ